MSVKKLPPLTQISWLHSLRTHSPQSRCLEIIKKLDPITAEGGSQTGFIKQPAIVSQTCFPAAANTAARQRQGRRI